MKLKKELKTNTISDVLKMSLKELKTNTISDVLKMSLEDVLAALNYDDDIASNKLNLEIKSDDDPYSECKKLRRIVLNAANPNKNISQNFIESNSFARSMTNIPHTHFQQPNNPNALYTNDLPPPGFNNSIHSMHPPYVDYSPQNTLYKGMPISKQNYPKQKFELHGFIPLENPTFPGNSMVGDYSMTLPQDNFLTPQSRQQENVSLLNFLDNSNFSSPINFFSNNNNRSQNTNNQNPLNRHVENVLRFGGKFE